MPDECLEEVERRARTAMVAAVRFLASLGVTEYPVFGLITNGLFGAVTYAVQTETGVCTSV